MNTFTYAGFLGGKQCAFCKTSLSVKYIVTLDTKYPKDSIVQQPRVWACNTCVAKRIGKGEFA